MMLTLSMLAAAFAGCLGGDDDDWELTSASDVNAEFVESGWDPIIPNLNAGEMCDAIISAMTKTEARDQVVDFTRAYYTSSQGVIGGSGSASISEVSALNAAGTIIGVQSGTTSDIYANANLASATINAYEDFPSVIAALNNGDVHYAMGDAPVLSLEGDLMVTFSDENFGLAVREDSGELLAALDVAIGAIVASGEYDAIYGAWFDGAVTLADDSTADTATAYPAASEGSTLAAVLESGSLKLCTDPFYPPFENYDADGNVEGFDADMANAIADEIAANYMGTANPMFQAPEPTTVNIKIGALYDSTGPIADFAPGFSFAVATAISDLNTAAAAIGKDMHFEAVTGDTGCNGDTAGASAQSLVDSGVVGVAGAACSGASQGANAVLSAAGIPMVSFASTSPALSDATAHPDFFRVVPSDALQGNAMVAMVSASGATNPALVHMVNSYGAGLADSFKTNWEAAGNTLCAQIGYDEQTTTDYSALVQSVIDAGDCDAVVLSSYAADGAILVETMAGAQVGLPIFGADGIAGEAALDAYSNPAASNGIQVTKPSSASGSGDFPDQCSLDAGCSSGIFTSEAYDAVMIIGQAAMHEDGANMASHIAMVGTDYAGASGTHTFFANGDVAGSGYDVCTFNHIPTYGEYFNCDRAWTSAGGLAAVPWAGAVVKIGFMGDATSPAISDYWVPFQVAAMIGLNIANTIAYNQGVQFELVWGDTACNQETSAASAQSLVDSGVIGVVGAACSGASIGANSIFAANGIPMISYASTSPALSDATTYPDFFRVVPSDAGQGMALSDVLTANGEATDGVALIHMVNSYGAGLADSFKSNWEAAGNTLCAQIGYDEAGTVDYAALAQQVMNDGCTAVLTVSYNADGAMVINELAAAGFMGQIYGTDGIAEEAIAAHTTSNDVLNGIIATKPASATPSEVSMTFDYLCAMTTPCDLGIFTAEAFDAVTIMAFAAFTQMANPGITLSQAIAGTGQGWNGASGSITFLANGDTPGSGYCVGVYTADSSGVSFDCTQHWGASGLTDL